MKFFGRGKDREPRGTGKRNPRRLFRRNQIIITSLSVMVAAAGYLNYAGKEELAAGSTDVPVDSSGTGISGGELYLENQAGAETAEPEESLAQIDSWDGDGEAADAAPEDAESGLENPGEAVLTNGLTVSDYIAGVQLNREQLRARNLETLNGIIDNESLTDAARQEAVQNMILMTETAEKENAAETLLQAKGFADPVVSLTDGKADVVINAVSITDQQRAQIEDIVKRKAQVAADGIVISLLNLEDQD